MIPAESIRGSEGLENVLAGNLRLHLVAVQAVRVLVGIASTRRMEAEAIRVSPRSNVPEVDSWVTGEGSVGQVVLSPRVRAALGRVCHRVGVDTSGSLCIC